MEYGIFPLLSYGIWESIKKQEDAGVSIKVAWCPLYTVKLREMRLLTRKLKKQLD